MIYKYANNIIKNENLTTYTDCSTPSFNPNIIEVEEKNVVYDNSFDSPPKYKNIFSEETELKTDKNSNTFSFKDTLNFFNIKSDGDRVDMFGFSLRIDTIIIIGIILFLIFQNAFDFILIICLGLILLDFKLDFLQLF